MAGDSCNVKLRSEVCNEWFKQIKKNENLFQILGDSVTPFLSWEKIYEFIAKHLQTERYAIMYGPSLINMLERFLSVHIYTRVIDGHRWTGTKYNNLLYMYILFKYVLRFC